MSQTKPKPIAYVVDKSGLEMTVCFDCHTGVWEPQSIIKNVPSFGDSVPYPECYECGEVARPETLSNFDAELPDELKDEL